VPDTLGEQSRRDLAEQKLTGYQGATGIRLPHLMLGLNVLRKLHLYIATDEHVLYATAADAH
jgi:hypothetical protein